MEKKMGTGIFRVKGIMGKTMENYFIFCGVFCRESTYWFLYRHIDFNKDLW